MRHFIGAWIHSLNRVSVHTTAGGVDTRHRCIQHPWWYLHSIHRRRSSDSSECTLASLRNWMKVKMSDVWIIYEAFFRGSACRHGCNHRFVYQTHWKFPFTSDLGEVLYLMEKCPTCTNTTCSTVSVLDYFLLQSFQYCFNLIFKPDKTPNKGFSSQNVDAVY